MNKEKFDCSINDTAELRKLILENPELPMLIFCGEEAWNGEYGYTQADASNVGIEELTLFNNRWLDKVEYEEELLDIFSGKEEYRNMSNQEFDKAIKKKVEETEFVKTIVIFVG